MINEVKGLQNCKLGAVHKKTSAVRVEGFVHCGQGGFFRCRRPHYGFFEIYDVPAHGQEELSLCGHFTDKEGRAGQLLAILKILIRAVHNRLPQPGGVCPVQTSVLQMRTSYFLVQKLRIFPNLWYVRLDKEEGIESVWTFCGQGEGANFSRFCVDVFYGQHLTNC